MKVIYCNFAHENTRNTENKERKMHVVAPTKFQEMTKMEKVCDL